MPIFLERSVGITMFECSKQFQALPSSESLLTVQAGEQVDDDRVPSVVGQNSV